MLAQTLTSPPRVHFLFLPQRMLRALGGLCLAGLVASAQVSAAGLSADTADLPASSDSLSQSLIAPSVEIGGGQVLSEHDLAYLIAALEDPTSHIPEDVNERVHSVLSQALAQLGIPYRWGGTAPSTGFDCSGLVKYVFKTALGIELPRVSREQAKSGQVVDKNALTPGDLVFFSRKGKTINHVGIYLGDGRFVHAPRTGRDVTISKLAGYWYQRFLRARRVADLHD